MEKRDIMSVWKDQKLVAEEVGPLQGNPRIRGVRVDTITHDLRRITLTMYTDEGLEQVSILYTTRPLGGGFRDSLERCIRNYLVSKIVYETPTLTN